MIENSRANFEEILNLANRKDLSAEIQKMRRLGLEALIEGIESVLPSNLIENSVKIQKELLIIQNSNFNLSNYKKIVIIGGGKATGNMAYTLIHKLPQNIPVTGIINVPKDQIFPSVLFSPSKHAKITVNFTTHPIPNEVGMEGVQKMINLIEKEPEDILIFTLISGGGSALLPLPAGNVKLEDIIVVNRLLLESGANIEEINCIRKHLSAFKGGNLAKISQNHTMICLILSDVIGNRLDVIASGPTVPDPSTFLEAQTIARKYNIWDTFPETIKTHIQNGIDGFLEETPKPSDPLFQSIHNFIIGSAKTSSDTVLNYFQKQKIDSNLISHQLQGEAKEFGKSLVNFTFGDQNYQNLHVFLGTGEFTVTLKGKGTGGRNQEMLLSFLLELTQSPKNFWDHHNFVIIAGAFDGIEGNSPAMGAIVDSTTLQRVSEKGISMQDYLERNASYEFFRQLNDAIITGSTGTNVNDMLIIMVQRKGEY